MINYEWSSSTLLTEKQLLKTKEVEDYSPCFHSEDKGCELEDIVLMKQNSNGIISQLKCQHCKTHDIDVCRCGWEWHMHYDTNSLHMRRYPKLTIRNGRRANKKDKEKFRNRSGVRYRFFDVPTNVGTMDELKEQYPGFKFIKESSNIFRSIEPVDL